MHVYVDDGTPVPAGVRVFEDRFGFFEDKDGRKVINVSDADDDIGIAPPQDNTAFTMVQLCPKDRSLLERIAAKVGA